MDIVNFTSARTLLHQVGANPTEFARYGLLFDRGRKPEPVDARFIEVLSAMHPTAQCETAWASRGTEEVVEHPRVAIESLESIQNELAVYGRERVRRLGTEGAISASKMFVPLHRDGDVSLAASEDCRRDVRVGNNMISLLSDDGLDS